jgi:hypothetical protein
VYEDFQSNLPLVIWHNGANSCSMQYSMQWEPY